MAFSPDAKLLAAAGDANGIAQLTLWNTETLLFDVYDFGVGHTVASVSFAPNGKTLALATTDGRIIFWDVEQKQSRSALRQANVRALAFSPNGQILASGGEDLILWEVAHGRLARRLTGHERSINSVAFSPDGQTLASASSLDESVRLWDIRTGKLKRTLRMKAWSVAFSPDGLRLATGGANIDVWDAKTFVKLATVTNGRALAHAMAFSPNGRALAAAGTGFDDAPGELRLVHLSDQPVTATLLESSDRGFRTVAISPDERFLAAGSAYGRGRLQLWDLRRLRNN